MATDVTKFGAIGDGETLNTAAIQSAIDSTSAAGGGTVNVPAGRYVTGALSLRSNITLHLEAGAILLGSERFDDFPIWTSRWEGSKARPSRAPLIGGEDAEHIAITGRGIVDGRGKIWWDAMRRDKTFIRPQLLRFVNCKNVLIEGVTFRNSPRWTVSPLACDNLTIRGITIENPSDSPNTDGINPECCRNVRISECHVDVGDDCITIKSGREDDGRAEKRACENITVTNCTLVHGHGGVVIGSEISGSVRNVTISNCVFVGTDRGIRIKARRGRGGVVEDLRVSNLVMDSVCAALTMNLFYGCDGWDDPRVTDHRPQPIDAGTPRFRRLHFSHITATRVKWAGIFVLGLPEMPVEQVTYDDISISLDPENTEGGSPVMAPGVGKHCRAGVVIQNASEIALHHIDVRDQLGPKWKIESSIGVEVDGKAFDPSPANPLG